MSGRKSRRSHPPLEQTRLADLNYNFQTVSHNSRKFRPLPEKQKQAGLDAFGFSLKSIAKTSRSATPTPLTSSVTPQVDTDGSPPKKRHKAIQSEEIIPKRPTRFRAGEIAETQFAYPGSLSQSDSDDAEEEEEDEREDDELDHSTRRNSEKTPPLAEHPPTPTSVVSLPPPRPYLMLPPMTPKRRRKLEIPSSHSPPVTPLSPYRPTPQSSPIKSPLSRRRVLVRTPTHSPVRTNHSKIASSQWWDNEDTQQESLSTQLVGEEVEGGIQSTSFRHGPLFPTPSPQPERYILSKNQPQSSSYKRNSDQKIKLELPDEDDVMDNFPPVVSCVKKRTQGPMAKSPPAVIKQERVESPRVKQEPSVESSQGLFSFSEQGETQESIIPESPLKSCMSSIKREAVGRDIQQMALPATRRRKTTLEAVRKEAMTETQYDCTAEYDWWDLNPILTGTNATQQKHERKGEENEVVKKDSPKADQEDCGSEDHDASVTMSQLLPSTLMESFPMPQPVSQWQGTQYDSNSFGNDDLDDDDEL